MNDDNFWLEIAAIKYVLFGDNPPKKILKKPIHYIIFGACLMVVSIILYIISKGV